MPPQPGVATDDCVDLLVIGGGINGVGIARDAAGRGHKVVLIEQSDLAAATSSSSTKLIHGGLRYLEHFEFRLVREALIERERLLAIAPHIIRPMSFVLPHVEGLRPRWQIRVGLFLYDHIGGRRILPPSQGVHIAGTPYGAQLSNDVEHGFVYSDCWVDDSRLVVLNAMDAAQRGARILPRARFISAEGRNDVWHAQYEDQRTRERHVIKARALVNATGPWVERVLHLICGAQSESQVRLVKGSHIVVPQLYAGEHAYMLQNPDGRIVFTIPYENSYTLIGTTDVPFNGSTESVRISSEEVTYLCDTVNSYFQRTTTPSAVKWSYAGVRPLSDDESSNASKVTRDYKLELSAGMGQPPVLSVFGGKITTYRRLAEAALSRLHPYIGGSTQSWTALEPLPGGELPRADFAAFLEGVRRRWPFLDAALALRMARAYGTRIGEILGAAKEMGDLGASFGAGLSGAEVDYLRKHEWAMTANDILWRRTKLGLHMTTLQQTALVRYLQSHP